MNLFVLLDSRTDPQQIDLEFMEWLGECGIPFSIVFTKTDKLKSANKVRVGIENYTAKMLERWEQMPVHFATSAETGAGMEELEAYILELNEQIAQQ